MRLFQELLQNDPLLVGIVAWLLAQALKVVTHYGSTRKVDFRMWASSGGMPSSHSAFVAALATVVGFREGFDSSLFAICAIFGGIVMYDATGVRLAASHQARILNQIVAELFEGHPISQRKLKELIGHTPFQVIVGALLGVTLALIWEFAILPAYS